MIDFEIYLKDIELEKITNTARVDCIWDAEGIWVDLNYSYDKTNGYGEYQTCFAELYDSGKPSEAMWDLALKVAVYMKNKFGIPLDVNKTEAED